MRRFGRRLDVETLRARAADARVLLRLPATRRRQSSPIARRASAMQRSCASAPGDLRIPRIVTTSADEAQAFYDAALAAGHEGVMAKSLDAPYEAGNRGAGWLKIKRAHTLDLVVHRGRMGPRPAHRQAIESASRCARSRDRRVRHARQDVQGTDRRDARMADGRSSSRARSRRDGHTVYVRPEIVVEIAFSDLQASPRYPGRAGASPRTREALSRRQARRRGRHDGIGAAHLRRAGLMAHGVASGYALATPSRGSSWIRRR